MDSLVASSMVVKTEYLVLPEIDEKDLLSVNKEESERYINQPDDIIDYFFLLWDKYKENVVDIFFDIIDNSKIPEHRKQTLYALYQNSFCETLSQEIAFCLYESMSEEQFAETYGQPSPKDNNADYLYNGIIGIYS